MYLIEPVSGIFTTLTGEHWFRLTCSTSYHNFYVDSCRWCDIPLCSQSRTYQTNGFWCSRSSYEFCQCAFAFATNAIQCETNEAERYTSIFVDMKLIEYQVRNRCVIFRLTATHWSYVISSWNVLENYLFYINSDLHLATAAECVCVCILIERLLLRTPHKIFFGLDIIIELNVQNVQFTIWHSCTTKFVKSLSKRENKFD